MAYLIATLDCEHFFPGVEVEFFGKRRIVSDAFLRRGMDAKSRPTMELKVEGAVYPYLPVMASRRESQDLCEMAQTFYRPENSHVGFRILDHKKFMFTFR